MITLNDCIALCGLKEEEILAIAEHEHLPEIAATALASFLCQQRGDRKHTLTLLHVLHHFLKTHPEDRPSEYPWSKRF